MKTKFASFILPLCCAFAAAVSCGKQAGEGAAIYGEADLIFNVSVGGATKAAAGYIDDTESEAAISSLRIFMMPAESDGTPVEGAAWTEITDLDYDGTTGTASKKFKHDMAGDYLFFAVANWPSSLTLDLSGYDALLECAFDASACLSDIWAEDSFAMNQNGGPVHKYITNLACDSGNPDEIDIVLERVAAKVSAKLAPSATYPLIGTIAGGSGAGGTATGYVISKVVMKSVALINCVNQFNFLKTLDSESGELVTPSSDPEYSLSSGYYNTSLSELDWVDFGTDMYCLENNSPYYADVAGDNAHPDATSTTKMKSRVTGLVFKVEIKTLSQYKNEADTDIENENLRVDPEEGLWKTKADSEEPSNDEEARTLYRYKGNLFVDFLQLSVQNEDIAASFSSEPSVEALREFGVNVYEDGLMYFTYWFRDSGVLSVTRNTYYNILVNQVASFGDEVPGGFDFDGTDPIDFNPDQIGITLSIADWIDTPSQTITLQ